MLIYDMKRPLGGATEGGGNALQHSPNLVVSWLTRKLTS